MVNAFSDNAQWVFIEPTRRPVMMELVKTFIRNGVFTLRKNLAKVISAITASLVILTIGTAASGCTASSANNGVFAATISTATSSATAVSGSVTGGTTAVSAAAGTVINTIANSGSATATVDTSILDLTDAFSDRDLEQTVDLSEATTVKLVSGQDVTLTEEGVYVLSGNVTDVSVIVEAADDAKIQLVLDSVRITNADSPAIYVKSADKVFVTTTASQNTLTVTDNFVVDGETNLDAVIFAKSDLTLNGTGTLAIQSSAGNGISSKDTLKVTGGTYAIQSAADALEANDAILISGGSLTIKAGKDALHSENAEDATLGYIVIQNGTLQISAADDAVRGTSFVQIDGGTIDITTCTEGFEANRIQVNGGKITLYAKDDGFNAAPKVNALVSIELNGGTISVKMGSGDTDAFDSNGNIVINGGMITVEAGSSFDADGTAVLNAGDVTVNGVKITQITSQQGGPGGMAGGKVRR